MQPDPCCGRVWVLDSAPPPATVDPFSLKGFLALEGFLLIHLHRRNEAIKRELQKDIDQTLQRFEPRLSYTAALLQNEIRQALGLAAERVQQAMPGLVMSAMLDMGKRVKRTFLQVPRARSDARDTTIEFSWEPKSTKWTEQDTQAMQWLGQNNALFMGKYYNEHLVDKARNIVTRDYSLYADNPDKVRQRVKEGMVAMVESTDAYWDVFATNALNNARSYTAIRTMSETGVVAYRIRAVLDSRTTTICRTMNARIFQVADAYPLFDQIAAAQSVDELDRISPMVRDQDGKHVIGRGEVRASFDQSITNGKLVSMGIMFPPFHFHCRSTVDAITGPIVVQVPSEPLPPDPPLTPHPSSGSAPPAIPPSGGGGSPPGRPPASTATPEPEDYASKRDKINQLKQQLQTMPTKEQHPERKRIIREFIASTERIEAEGFSTLLGEIEDAAKKLNKPRNDEKYSAQYGAVVGKLELLKLAYFVQAKGYTVQAVEVKYRPRGRDEGDVDLIATKDQTLLLLAESKAGTNVKVDRDIRRKTIPVYNAFVASELIDQYTEELEPGFNKKLVLYIPEDLKNLRDDIKDILGQKILDNFDDWRFIDDIEDISRDIL